MGIPEIGLGTWKYHGGLAPLQAGLEAGACFVDTAESYGTEEIVAEAVRGRRQEVFLATKVSREHLRAADVRRALKFIPAESLIVSTDCGFGRQGCNRDIAFFKTTAIAQGCNTVRAELGLPTTYVPAADPVLQTDIVPRQ